MTGSGLHVSAAFTATPKGTTDTMTLPTSFCDASVTTSRIVPIASFNPSILRTVDSRRSAGHLPQHGRRKVEGDRHLVSVHIEAYINRLFTRSVSSAAPTGQRSWNL